MQRRSIIAAGHINDPHDLACPIRLPDIEMIEILRVGPTFDPLK
jgi:hypothetical protein